MAVLTLTVKDDRLREVEAFAQKEERSRDEIVNEAIDIYLRKKAWSEIREWGRELDAAGVTEDDISEAIREAREEKRRCGFGILSGVGVFSALAV